MRDRETETRRDRETETRKPGDPERERDRNRHRQTDKQRSGIFGDQVWIPSGMQDVGIGQGRTRGLSALSVPCPRHYPPLC